MNWYKLIKLSQLWNTESTGDYFDELISKIYELEYKYQELLKKRFNGIPHRRDYILNRIEKELIKVISQVKNVFINVFKKWLDSHALTDANLWATKRIEESYGSSTLQDIIAEYQNYINSHKTSEEVIQDIMDHISDNLEQFPSLTNSNLFDNLRIDKIDEEKRLLEDDLTYFNEANGTKFKTKTQALNFIENKEIDDASLLEFLADMMSSAGIDDFSNLLSDNNVDENEFYKEAYEHIIFPYWYGYWSSMGIDDTRDNIEKIYDLLVQSNDIPNSLSAISLAISATHQNGSMLEYVAEYGAVFSRNTHQEIIRFLTDLSNNKDMVQRWDKQLQEVGVDTNQFNKHKMYDVE